MTPNAASIAQCSSTRNTIEVMTTVMPTWAV